jgi:hypothetical protein
MSIKKSDKEKYKDRVQAYIDGKGKYLPKWLKPPVIDEAFLEGGSDIVITDAGCQEMYPFDPGTPDKRKFRLLIALRFTCLIGGMNEDSEEVKYITEWLRQLLLFSEPLRKECGITKWRPIWQLDNI